MEPTWLEWHTAPATPMHMTASQRTCGRTSLSLARALTATGWDASWPSGTPRLCPKGPDLGDFSFRSATGCQSHAWGDRNTALPEFILARGRAADEIRPRWLGMSLDPPACARWSFDTAA